MSFAIIPIFGFLGHFYGYSYEDCLKLPIQAFFRFYEEGLKMEARYFRELLDISVSPKMKLEYYEFLRHRYNMIENPNPPKIPEPPTLPPLPSGSDERKYAVLSIFTKLRRSKYGR